MSREDSWLYREYQRSLRDDRMVRSIRTTTAFVVVVNTLFIALDYASHPDHFGILLSVRASWNAGMALCFWLASRFDPLRVLQAGVIFSGVALLALIAAAGGLSSQYWPGIMILFVGIPVFLPLSGGQAGILMSFLLSGFVAIPLFAQEDLTLGEFMPPVFFATAAALECVASSALLDRLRLADFKQKRALEEMDRLKTRFTANVHHELRTPLTLTLAPLESLLNHEFGELTELQRRYLTTMHANALRLLKLINNLLDLAKIESEQLELNCQPVDLGGLIKAIVGAATPLAERKGVQLVSAGALALPPVIADPEALDKVLLNLVGNALKFTESGGHVSIEGSAKDNGVQIVVTDTGIGLPAQQAGRIFDRFAQVDNSATRKHEGTGIGLSLAKELIELHGGRIWAESPGLGAGLSVGFWIPSATAAAGDLEGAGPIGVPDRRIGDRSVEATIGIDTSEVRRDVERWEDGQSDVCKTSDPPIGAEGAEILVCEDNPDMRQLLCDLLAREYRVRAARNGAEGLKAITQRQPDLVLTDVMMPEMSGVELCERIKRSPATRGIPVVLVTSKAEREMQIDGLERGADDYVTKPFHSRELLARVRSLVRLRQLQEELAKRNAALEQSNLEVERAIEELRDTEAHLVQTERLAAVGEIAAGIAHEINNPINFSLNALQTMQAYVEELCEVARGIRLVGEEDVRIKKAVDEAELDTVVDTLQELSGIAREGLTRTGRLVGDLRDFAAPRAAEQETVDIRQCLESAMQLTRHSMQKAGVIPELSADACLPSIWGDPRALGQVFLNLAKNATEALEDGGGTLRVAATVGSQGLEIVFEDDGPGVSEEIRERIFEPFFSTKAPGRGTGLGLSISRKVIQAHGGTIHLEPRERGGSRFVIRFPGRARDGK